MADYTKTSGTAGVMTMSDNGTTISFYFQAGYSNDHWEGMKWSYTANGVTTPKTINYATGRPKVLIGSVNVTSTQTVTFKLLTATGTNGMGGPTTFSRLFDRGSVPPPPTKPLLSDITASSMVVKFNSTGNGGLTNDQYRIGYSINPGAPSVYATSSGTSTIGGLYSGTRYYFWSQAHNAKGWSALSARADAVTLRVPYVPGTPIITAATSTTVSIKWTAASNGGSAVLEYEIGYGTIASSAQQFKSSSPDLVETITGLTPGVGYYFWVRARNAIGWGEWSARGGSDGVAGAWVLVGTTWQRAVPYVNVGGTWMLAEPWVKQSGTWKRTS